MSKRKSLLVGCGEWGFREMPMEEHFRITAEFGMKYLEFGIGGGQVGRLPEAPTPADVEAFLGLTKKYGIQCPFCCIENDFTLGDPGEHEAMVEKVIAQIRSAAECQATHVRQHMSGCSQGLLPSRRWMKDVGSEC